MSVDPMNVVSARYAVVRPVPDSYDDCVRTSVEEINIELARIQHAEYCRNLQKLGLSLVWVEGDNGLPDSCFVEDTAVIFGKKAVICRMSVESRTCEVAAVAKVLEKLKQVHYTRSPAMIDGGDVLKIEDRVFIGLSARTNERAVEQIKEILEDSNLEVISLRISKVLHLKSACTYLGNNCVVLSKGCFDEGVLSGLNRIVVPKGEGYAADCLAVNGTVLLAKGYPRARALIEREGFHVEELDVSEFRKGDGALTCLSIIL
jgi:dimethylargininase